MSIEVDWTFVVQSRLRMPLKEYFRKAKVTNYEEAAESLRRSGLPVGTRDQVAPHLPPASDTNASSDNSNPATRSHSMGSRPAVQAKKQKDVRIPTSPAEAAADAIAKSKAVKSPQEKTTRKRTRKPKKS
jgi:hypothetical protein